jgi:hypothetical protein
MGQNSTPTIRRDGWTAERQLRFLDVLARSRSVTAAATSVGMSRESAYRLRSRLAGGLFALLWDRALVPDATRAEGHSEALSDGRIARLLGPHFRRKAQQFPVGGEHIWEAPASVSSATFVTFDHSGAC